jgi:N-acetylmuramoyl-L-alanine amidase
VLRDAVEVNYHQERLTGGIVDLVQYVGGRENLFAMTLGRRFAQLKYAEQEVPSRLTLEFEATPESAGKADAAPAAGAARPQGETRGLRTVVIDPGHGGADTGAKGPGGALEKDVALALARKLRAQLVNNLGLQVFLTREGDQEIGLDQRTAIANNYKADLFISIHANASRARGAKGSEVYFLSYEASDDETRRLALTEGALPALAGAGAAAPPPPSDVAMILWDMAQAEHLEESSALASRLIEELAEVTGREGRGVKQAPFRVLVGAGMPAVLVELAFISNPEEEKELVSEPWQARVATALSRGIGRYESARVRRSGALAPSARPGP